MNYVFVDEAGPVELNNIHIFLIGIVVTTDKLNWVNENYHYKKDDKLRRKEFLSLILTNAEKLKIIINIYIRRGHFNLNFDTIFKLYIRDVINSLVEFKYTNLLIFYDSLEDKLPERLRGHHFDSRLWEYLRNLRSSNEFLRKTQFSVKTYLSVGKSQKLAELYRKGISIADYITSSRLQVLRATIDPELYNILQQIYKKSLIKQNFTEL